METPETVSYSTESAFHALGLPDADDLQLRADLMRSIVRIIAERKLTQAQAGRLMAMDQPRVSALINGKITLFSTDRFLRALSDLRQDVEVRVTPSRGEKGSLRLAARALGSDAPLRTRQILPRRPGPVVFEGD